MAINFDEMSLAELADLRSHLDREISIRTKDRIDELIENFIDAANALATEAPNVSLDMEFMCEDCYHFEKIDILRGIREETLSMNDFKRWGKENWL